jgi:uncharacterized damage-inducible protein DinB
MNKLEKKHQELISLKNEWLEWIKDISNEKLNHKNSENEWSITQVFTHIIESESGTNKYINYKLKEVDSLDKTSLKNSINSKGLNMALKSSKKFKAPKVVSNPINDLDFNTISEKWNKSREFLADTVSNFPKEAVGKAIFKHPKAGKFNINQTLDFLINHMKHHQMQIDRIKKTLIIN